MKGGSKPKLERQKKVTDLDYQWLGPAIGAKQQGVQSENVWLSIYREAGLLCGRVKDYCGGGGWDKELG